MIPTTGPIRHDRYRFCPACGSRLEPRRLRPDEPKRLVCSACAGGVYLDPQGVSIGGHVQREARGARHTTTTGPVHDSMPGSSHGWKLHSTWQEATGAVPECHGSLRRGFKLHAHPMKAESRVAAGDFCNEFQ